MSKNKKPKTHFAQVPLEIVKKIGVEEIPEDEDTGEEVIVEDDGK